MILNLYPVTYKGEETMIFNIYSVTPAGALKIDQIFFLANAKPEDKVDVRHFFTSDLAKNRYSFHFGSLPVKEGD